MEPWRYPPQRMIFDPPPMMFTYQQPESLGMIMRPNFLFPPPVSTMPSPMPDTASSIVSLWETEFGPTFTQRREELDAKRRLSVVDFKKKLVRWKELLENSRSASAKEELERLEQECTDPDLLQIMKRKSGRNRRRKRPCQDLPVVLPTSVGETLSRISAADASEPSQQPPPSVPLKEPENTDLSTITKYLADLKSASAFCQEKVRILNKLKQLRDARVVQLRNQGKLIPEQLDEVFEKERHSIYLEIEAMQKAITEVTIRLEGAKQALTQEPEQPVVSSDATVTPLGLPEDVHYLLFGPQNDTGSRWHKFFCQANRNFSDFLRIRSRWDEYLVPSNSMEVQNVADSSRHPPSLLPITWELPPSHPP